MDARGSEERGGGEESDAAVRADEHRPRRVPEDAGGGSVSVTERGVLLRCLACAREQRIYMPDHDAAFAREFAGPMDGTSEFYTRPVEDSAWIGRCQACG